MLFEMPSQLVFLLAANGWLSATQINLRLQSSQLALLANELAHHSATDRKTHRQNRVTSLLVSISGHNSPPQIHR
jgi:hypothetical protein